ncbi:hypothetical protein [Oceaniglobus trochenteri]|uniref:hypothetical protein n=1 Tax=Oceaniglobus trochenteri TaxID=2763260 RepID=UPI001CFFA108|nr:hypothetical protein [Oceaniglobus trochenteri]
MEEYLSEVDQHRDCLLGWYKQELDRANIFNLRAVKAEAQQEIDDHLNSARFNSEDAVAYWQCRLGGSVGCPAPQFED